MKIKLTLIQPMLGTCPADPHVYEEFIASKNPAGTDQTEVEASKATAEQLEESEDLSLDQQTNTTVFLRDEDGNPMILNHMLKGFLKEAGNNLRQLGTSLHIIRAKDDKRLFDKKNPFTAAKKKIDSFVAITPRQAALGGVDVIDYVERSLRAQTPKGERVALARSESVPAGTTIEFEIKTVKGGPITPEMVEAMLDYGQIKGLGQWRNNEYGSFTWERTDSERITKPVEFFD